MQSEPYPSQYGVIEAWRFQVIRIERVTDQCIFYREDGSSRERRVYREKLLLWTDEREVAEKAAVRMTSADAESRQREQAARLWRQAEIEKIASATMEPPHAN